jgi:hypothetical protein
MSRVPGLRLQDFLKTNPSQELRDQLGTGLTRLFFFQLFRVQALQIGRRMRGRRVAVRDATGIRAVVARTRREGTIDGLSGVDTLEAVRKGHIWVLLQQPHEIAGGYGDLLRDIYAELEERVPGFKSYKHKMSILISSPKVQVYYHADVPGQTLWQVRGTKRVYVYPNTAPFLPQPGIEKIVLGEAHEVSLQYEPWFDQYAEVIDLEPGRMLHWPLNCPHRIVNADCLNVSFTTEHMTDELRNAYAVNYANGILRRTLGLQNLARPTSGLGLYGRLGLAAAYKFSGLQTRRKSGFKVDFKVDPTAPFSVRNVPAFDLRK